MVTAKGTMNAAQCACAVRAFAKCRVQHEQLMGAVSNLLRDKEARISLSPLQLTAMVYGYAKFTSQDTALLDLLSIEVRRRLHLVDASLP